MAAVLLVRHALGWAGDTGYEHVEELMAQLEQLAGGWTLGDDRGGSLTGGGQGYFLIWGAARALGLPFPPTRRTTSSLLEPRVSRRSISRCEGRAGRAARRTGSKADSLAKRASLPPHRGGGDEAAGSSRVGRMFVTGRCGPGLALLAPEDVAAAAAYIRDYA